MLTALCFLLLQAAPPPPQVPSPGLGAPTPKPALPQPPAPAPKPAPDDLTPLKAVPFDRVQLRDAFFAPRIDVNRRVSIEAVWKHCEESGRFRNFAIAAGQEKGKRAGAVYDDSDVYKLLEGVAYSLRVTPDPKLEARADALVEQIAAAQQKDGYLDTWFQVVAPDQKWKDVRNGHELYCVGHLIEAGLAYETATGKKKLLETAVRAAACVDAEFGWGKHQEPTGHPELELALVKLFRRTGEERWLKLARFFLDVRGKKDRGTALFGENAQDHLPVREQTEAVGHAVRATYLYSAMADVAAETRDKTLTAALENLWQDVLDHKMYVTGGVGSRASNEGFGAAYELPNDTAYCETCAAIGMVLWNHRMFLLTRRTKYLDVMERELYNNVAAGVSLSGDRFFYANPLSSRGDVHRSPWFSCACCPTNLVRFLPAMGERIYAVSPTDLYVNLYGASTADVQVGGARVTVTQDTDFPVGRGVTISFVPEKTVRFALHLRVPSWAPGAVLVAPKEPPGRVDPTGFPRRRKEDGSDEYVIDREWRAGDRLRIEMPNEPKTVQVDPKVEDDMGRTAVQYGPFVYCFEAVDNEGHARNLVLPAGTNIEAETDVVAFGGIPILRAKGEAVAGDDPFHHITHPANLTAIPYCMWDNRPAGPWGGEMVVWIAQSADVAEIPGFRNLPGGIALRSSLGSTADALLAPFDGKTPSAADRATPRFVFEGRKGTSEWLEMRFREPRTVHAAKAWWFVAEDGSVRAPESWSLEVRVDGKWTPVQPQAGAKPGVDKDAWNAVEFAPVRTDGVRLVVKLAPDASAGLYEWQVE